MSVARRTHDATDWFDQLPPHWRRLKIKRLCIVKRGASPRPIDDPIYFDDDGSHGWVRIADVTASNKYLRATEQRLSTLGRMLSVAVSPGDLVVSIAGTVGKPIIIDIPSCIHDGFVYFIGLKENPEFLYYVFRSGRPYEGLGKLGTQLNLNTNTIGDIVVPMPDRETQNSVVEFLDRETSEADILLAKYERLIEFLEEKRGALITQAVTKGLDSNSLMKDSGVRWIGKSPIHWQIMPLKFAVSMKSGEQITSREINESGEFPVYGGNGLRGYTDRKTHSGKFPLIGRQGALCGNINYANGEFWASEHAVVVTPRVPCEIYWLGEMLRAMNLGQYSATAAQPGLSVNEVGNLRIPLPPLSEQAEIASYIKNESELIDRLKNKTMVAMALLREHRSALITAAVTGQIDINNYHAESRIPAVAV